MFKFDFKLEDDELDASQAGPSTSSSEISGGKGKEKEIKPCYHVTLDELISTLPETMSYSPLYHPCLKTPLLRRDLFDARFQLISSPSSTHTDIDSDHPGDGPQMKGESATRQKDGEGYVDAATDLIPGLYEGGLKTWEGGVDLVEVLSGVGRPAIASSRVPDDSDERQDGYLGQWVRGGSVLEVGCGTALPTAFLLRSLLESSHPHDPHSLLHESSAATDRSSANAVRKSKTTTFHLQDYNHLVLSLVTLPNLILSSLHYLPSDLLRREDDSEAIDLSQPGNLDLSPELISAFRDLLVKSQVELKFSYGDWSGLSEYLSAGNESAGESKGPDEKRRGTLVLTAETIYSEDSVGSLLDVLRASCTSRGRSDTTNDEKHNKMSGAMAKGDKIEDGLRKLDLGDWAGPGLGDSDETIVLVAAKVLYFGVGGGIQQFLAMVEERGGWWTGVKDWIQGVRRKVVRVGW